jgi:hypothetical protein
MNKILFKIFTPYGDCYAVNELGQICKPSNIGTYYGFSDGWKIQGIEHVKMNWFIPFNKLTKEIVKDLPLKYKNGNPQFTVRDLDHGTTRTWGNTKYHAIADIHFIS